jgi:hypothetical protein
MSGRELLDNPERQRELDLFVGVLGSIVENRDAVYLSGPLTTGPRFLRWYTSRGRMLESDPPRYESAHRAEVIQPNVAMIRSLAHRLRQAKGWQVIEPTAFEVPQWSQEDYRYFWGRVIERYACRVVFVDGWEYSKGACYEFLVAVGRALETLSQEGTPITLAQARARIDAAVREMHELGVHPGFNGGILTALDRLAEATEPAGRSVPGC